MTEDATVNLASMSLAQFSLLFLTALHGKIYLCSFYEVWKNLGAQILWKMKIFKRANNYISLQNDCFIYSLCLISTFRL